MNLLQTTTVVLTDPLSRFRKPPAAYAAAVATAEDRPDGENERLPVRRQRQRRLTTMECQRVIETYLAGSSMNQVAAELHVHRTTIAACLRKHDVPLHRRGIPSGEVEAAAACYRDGWSLARLAERYGCSAMTVHAALIRHGVDIRPRKGWPYATSAPSHPLS